MRWLTGDGEFGVIAVGAAPVGVVAIGGAPVGVFAFGPIATGVVAISVGAGWVRGYLGVMVGAGVVTAWRSYLVGAGAVLAWWSQCVGVALAVVGKEADGMSLPWEWGAQAPRWKDIRLWWTRRRRSLREPSSWLEQGEEGELGWVAVQLEQGVVLATPPYLESIPVEEVPPEASEAIGVCLAHGGKPQVEARLGATLATEGYRGGQGRRLVYAAHELMRRPWGTAGFWVMLALILFFALGVRVDADVEGAISWHIRGLS